MAGFLRGGELLRTRRELRADCLAPNKSICLFSCTIEPLSSSTCGANFVTRAGVSVVVVA